MKRKELTDDLKKNLILKGRERARKYYEGSGMGQGLIFKCKYAWICCHLVKKEHDLAIPPRSVLD